MNWQDGEWFCAASSNVLEISRTGCGFQLCVDTLVEWSK